MLSTGGKTRASTAASTGRKSIGPPETHHEHRSPHPRIIVMNGDAVRCPKCDDEPPAVIWNRKVYPGRCTECGRTTYDRLTPDEKER